MSLHTCILTEYVYAEKAKVGTIGVQAFASDVQTKLSGRGREHVAGGAAWRASLLARRGQLP